VIVLGGHGDAAEVLGRYRVQLCDPKIAGSKQPFHHAESMSLPRAEAFIERCKESSQALSNDTMKDMLEFTRACGLELVGGAILAASGRALPPLRDVLASHALIHSAEGEFYRNAIACALEREKVSVSRIREREAIRRVSDATGLSETALKHRLGILGKAVGPPWTQDQKLAALAAWIILADT